MPNMNKHSMLLCVCEKNVFITATIHNRNADVVCICACMCVHHQQCLMRILQCLDVYYSHTKCTYLTQSVSSQNILDIIEAIRASICVYAHISKSHVYVYMHTQAYFVHIQNTLRKPVRLMCLTVLYLCAHTSSYLSQKPSYTIFCWRSWQSFVHFFCFFFTWKRKCIRLNGWLTSHSFVQALKNGSPLSFFLQDPKGDSGVRKMREAGVNV